MSREIKFRAWNAFNKRWLYNLLYRIDGESSDLDRYELVQYTGLKDKNGVEIYEGDICLDELGDTFKVIFEDGCYYAEYLNKGILIFGFDVKFNIIAIGNIYENPELLES